jgi:cytochrome b6-f complex iron-sulfur subunit
MSEPPEFDGVWMPRRDLFSKLAWVSVLTAMVGAVVASIRMLFPRVFFDPPMTFRAGSPADYPPGSVSERWKKDWRVWIVRTDQGLFALSANCTHLGCTPVWLEAENRFQCPCHGSAYSLDGQNIEGPAPRPLERFGVTLDRQGRIVVDKRRVFRRELGEWNNPGSFLRL